jgi:TFIIF-interacting CTD phosphatase-like protein
MACYLKEPLGKKKLILNLDETLTHAKHVLKLSHVEEACSEMPSTEKTSQAAATEGRYRGA